VTSPALSYDLATAAGLVGVSPKTLQRQIDAGKLESRRVGVKVLITHATLTEWLAALPTKAAKPEPTRRTR